MALDRSLIEAAITGKRPHDHRTLLQTISDLLDAQQATITSQATTITQLDQRIKALGG